MYMHWALSLLQFYHFKDYPSIQLQGGERERQRERERPRHSFFVQIPLELGKQPDSFISTNDSFQCKD